MEHFHLDRTKFGPHDWFTSAELQRWVVRRSRPHARFVEIGTYLGRSAACFGVEIVNAGKQQHLTTIDLFADPEQERRARDNLAPLAAAVTVVKSDSVAAAAGFDDGSLDMVFIDGDHHYPAVSADIAAWRGKVRSGGILAGDDFWWPDPEAPPPLPGRMPSFPVWRAVEEAFKGRYELMVRRSWATWWRIM
ncbi:MAG: class I SAM-dependent methyltransferase [Alphaproteobacteria bacterium]